MSDSEPPVRRGGVRPLLVRLHFYAGILVGPFLLLTALTGFLYALAPQIENALYRDTIFVESSGTTVPVGDQVAAARERQPDGTLLAVRPAAGPGDTTRVLFDAPGLGESERLAVFVNPGNAQVTGELVAYGSSGALPFRTWLSHLHANLHLGDAGRNYSELAASWLWLIALAGLVLWFTGRRNGSRWRVERSGSARRRTLSWHGVLGTWVIFGMLFLSATGLTWSRFAGANVTELKASLDWKTPTVSTALTDADHVGHEGHAFPGGEVDPAVDEWTQALQSARSAQLDGPVEMVAPKKSGTSFVVSEIGKAWPTQADSVAVDPMSGKVVDVVRFDDYPIGAKLSRWGIDAHMGMLFGLVNQILLLIVAGTVVASVVWGYRMWWLRRPTRGHALRLGRPARRGAWREIPVLAVVVLLALAVGIGLFLPLFGISLAAFVVIDLIIGLYRWRKSGTTEQSPGEPVQEAAAEADELLV
ncbi:PepSY-associated TM helix domain-containing protein [Kribbella speibonae]|uniref:PepSY domain-containing protein n=1 Tax=Kribbella speibonae TaxID=1572660 RepID=A0A4V2M4J1_9ACTN|nr:PepSY-associated TM helix domain-containing protein [Kribbella speibonae]TCC35992.1 PepSY domain-containing protein [Kribbella speibonae]